MKIDTMGKKTISFIEMYLVFQSPMLILGHI